MKLIVFILFLSSSYSYCMEDFFGIKEISYQNEHFHHVLEYCMGKVFVTQISDTQGNILSYSGKIIQEDAHDQTLEHHSAHTTFIQFTLLLEREKQLLATRAKRKKEILGIKG